MMAVNISQWRKLALGRIEKFQLRLPGDWSFDRDDANARGEGDVNPAPSHVIPNPLRHS